ncbi:hypothetical protein [Sphingomonas sp.]|uniref:hypothetical protein n=1 Tax=Sphingomonas sp. TaxID=28214 RepID=UPI002FC6B936
MRILVPLLAALLVAGCATSVESRVESKLIEAGLSRPMASCMAERLVDRLSNDQLRELGGLANLRDRNLGTMTIEQLLRHLRASVDPQVYEVVTRAGIGCAIAG